MQPAHPTRPSQPTHRDRPTPGGRPGRPTGPDPSAGRARPARLAQLADVQLRRWSLPLLRASLGLVFVWFGLLKVVAESPVTELVAGTVPWLDPAWFVPALGAVEVALGVALVAGRWLTGVAAALVGHLSGTFLVLVTQPDVAFQGGNPLLLTTEGEFVVKNVVLISAGLVLAARLGPAAPHAAELPAR